MTYEYEGKRRPVRKLNKKTVCRAMVAFLVAVAYSMRFIANRRDVTDIAWLCTSLLRSGIYVGLFVAWGVSVRRRIIQVQTKQYLSAISALLVLWMAVRTLKYMIFDNQHIHVNSGLRRPVLRSKTATARSLTAGRRSRRPGSTYIDKALSS